MIRRKLIAAALFFTLFGIIALLPPFIFLFSFDVRIAGVPIEAVYIFVMWIVLVAGGRWFSRTLPHDPPSTDKPTDRRT